MIVLAVDPGRRKCGVAVVCDQQGVLHRSVLPRDEIAESFDGLLSRYNPSSVVVGSGTGARHLISDIESACGEVPVILMDEKFTTLDARQRYFLENPPRGWRRLVPKGLLTPPVPVDDYAAVILAEQFLCSKP